MRVIEKKIFVIKRVMRGGSTRIEKDSTRPRGFIADVTQFSEGAMIRAWGHQLEQGRLGSYTR